MKILVTGATGKLGSRLVPALLHAGYQIRVLRTPDNEVIKSLASEGAEIVQGNVMQEDSLAGAVADSMRWCILQHFSDQDNEKIRNVNLQGTMNHCRCC